MSEKALDIAARTGKDLDMVLIARGALFHDLGKALTHSYQHGEIGAEMGKRYGLPKAITDIARKHFHGGLTAKEAEHLDLPLVDYTPRLLEERIILYADRLIDIITEGFFNFQDDQEAEQRFEEIITHYRGYGKDKRETRQFFSHDQFLS